MMNAWSGPVYWLVLLSFRSWDKFLVNAVCCHATKTILLYHDPILSAARTNLTENISDLPKSRVRPRTSTLHLEGHGLCNNENNCIPQTL